MFAAAVELVSHESAAFKGAARRYSLCGQDAEDAYQRGLEILITKAPTDDRSELRPWLHTVIKHEALAIRRQRERLLTGGAEAAELASGTAPGPEEGAAERERLRRTGEALGQLKSSEIQCMLLKALGYSYDEIAARTGFSWTKVNRSLTEGRRRFFERFEQIESGRRCGRFRPLMSAACDGEADERAQRELRAHLESCQPCRALLRGYRSAPARLAELIPPALVFPVLHRTNWWGRVFDSIAIGAGDRAGALGWKVQQAAEAVTAQKAAAVVASTAALAGGAVVKERAHSHRAGHRSAVAQRPVQAPSPPLREPASADPSPQPQETSPPASVIDHAAVAHDDPGPEFSPEAGASSTAASPARSSTEAVDSGFENRGGSARPARDTSGRGEFGP